VNAYQVSQINPSNEPSLVANVVNGHTGGALLAEPAGRVRHAELLGYGVSGGCLCGAEDERHQRWKSARAVDPWHAAGALYANNDGNLYEDFASNTRPALGFCAGAAEQVSTSTT